MRLCVLIVVLGLAPGSAATLARQATPVATEVVLPPDAVVADVDLAGWSARSWQWSFSLPAAVNPFFDETGAICGYGQSGPVFFLSGAEHDVARTCVVPEGVHIFVPLVGSACSTVEPPPFFGEDAADLARCATDAVNHAEGVFGKSGMSLTVEGVDAGDLSAYRAVTPMYTLWLPEDNMLGVPERAANSVADSYQVMLAPLPVGEHVVEIVLPGPGGGVTITYTLTVTSGAYSGA
jgi:hypothetical protein